MMSLTNNVTTNTVATGTRTEINKEGGWEDGGGSGINKSSGWWPKGGGESNAGTFCN